VSNNVFTIESRAKAIPDIQRSFLWTLFIPTLPHLPGKIISNDDLELACKSTSIPQKSLEIYESFFFGNKQTWPISQSFSSEFSVVLEEREDQAILNLFTLWIDAIMQANPENPNASTSTYLTKKQYAKEVWLKFYKYNGKPMTYAIRYFNCFPKQISEVSLDYNSNESIKLNVTFAYDYFTLFKDQN
jgi:hypothetical protein